MAFLVVRHRLERVARAEAEPEGKRRRAETGPRISARAEAEATRATADLWAAEERAACVAQLLAQAGRAV